MLYQTSKLLYGFYTPLHLAQMTVNAKYVVNDQNGLLWCLAGESSGAKVGLIEIFAPGGCDPHHPQDIFYLLII